MKTFEEKLTAWVDGRLTGPELAAFEKELEANPQFLAKALAEQEAAVPEIGNLMRAHLAAPPLRNADFFNHQILRQIAQPAPTPAVPARRAAFWSLPRMAFSGASLLLVATLLYFAAVPNTRREVRQNQQYVSNILSARSTDPDVTVVNVRSDDPNITATAFHSKQDDVNVIWLDGLSYMPQDQKLK